SPTFQALAQDFAVPPQARLSQLDRHVFVLGVTNHVLHLVARAPETRPLVTQKGRLHGDVEGLADLDRYFRALRRVRDVILADERGLALMIAHVDAYDASRQLGAEPAVHGVLEPHDGGGVVRIGERLEPLSSILVGLACARSRDVEESDLLRLLVRDRSSILQGIDIVVADTIASGLLSRSAGAACAHLRIRADHVDLARHQLRLRIVERRAGAIRKRDPAWESELAGLAVDARDVVRLP